MKHRLLGSTAGSDDGLEKSSADQRTADEDNVSKMEAAATA
jgi:hypothetical protein